MQGERVVFPEWDSFFPEWDHCRSGKVPGEGGPQSEE